MASKLDQIVKGAPPASSKPALSLNGPSNAPDPLSILPSSPEQIYLNLLILEASLRSQYLTLRDRRRQHVFFLSLLAAWIALFVYRLFFKLREDGSGIGGSVYWVVEAFEKMSLLGGIITAILVWGTGQWERGIRWPRRWLGVTNRGLRSVNAKLVVTKGPWWKELFSTLSIVFPYSAFFLSQGSSFHYVNGSDNFVTPGKDLNYAQFFRTSGSGSGIREQDLAPGGDYIKLLLLSKPFSPSFRENWETYRLEYWEGENELRAKLRKKLHQQEREIAKETGGWLWWTGWRGWKGSRGIGSRGIDVDRSYLQPPHHHHAHAHRHSDIRPRLKEPGHRSGSNSRGSSRSTTPTFETDERPLSDRSRRGSSNSQSGDRERKKRPKPTTGSMRMSRVTGSQSDGTMARREDSFQSRSSGNESDRSITPIEEGKKVGSGASR